MSQPERDAREVCQMVALKTAMISAYRERDAARNWALVGWTGAVVFLLVSIVLSIRL